MSGEEEVMDFSDEPMLLRALDHVPTQDDAETGQRILERVLIADAVHDAQIWADMFERWESEWDPQKSGTAMVGAAADFVEGSLTDNPVKVTKGTMEGLKEFFVGFWMDGAYAGYRGRAIAFRHAFYDEVGHGAAIGLGADGTLGSWHEFLTAAQAGAWERIDPLSTGEKQCVAARALWMEIGLPTSWEEWQGVFNAGFLSSGIAAVLRNADADAL
jgi:hypothetical protein